MKNRITMIIITLSLLAILLSACTGATTTASSWGAATITESKIYYADNGQVMALKKDNGNTVWSYLEKPAATRVLLAAPVEVGEQLLVGDYSGLLVSINNRDGSENWQFAEAKDKYIDAPLVVNEAIYAPNADGTLYVLDLDGVKLWSFSADNALWAQPVSDGNVLYIPCMDHYLYALDLETGKLLWQQDLTASLIARATLVDGTIYLGNLDGGVFAIAAENGKVVWEQKVSGGVWSAPVHHDGKLFVGDQTGNINILNAVDGSIDQTIESEFPVLGQGAVLEDGIVFGNENGDIFLVGYDGVKKWTRTVKGAIYSHLVTDGELILVVTNKGEKSLVAFDKQGNEIWYKE